MIKATAHWLNRMVLALSIPAFLFIIWQGFQYVAQDRRAPIQVRSVTVVNSPVSPGGVIKIDVDRIKVRQCPSTWRQWLISDTGRQWNLLHGVGGSAIGIGDTVIRITRPVPPEVPPGKYIYRSTGIYDCPDGKHVIWQPDAPLKVRQQRNPPCLF